MQILFREIRAALDAGLHILAVHGAMSIPDICSALETTEPTKNVGDRYADWFDRYLGKEYSDSGDGTPILTGRDIWFLRCKMQHQGAMAHERHSAEISFSRNMHRCVSMGCVGTIGREVTLVPSLFVEDLLKGAADWLAAKDGDKGVQHRMGSLMAFYPQGSAQVRAPLIR
jgi:hypothetical protein